MVCSACKQEGHNMRNKNCPARNGIKNPSNSGQMLTATKNYSTSGISTGISTLDNKNKKVGIIGFPQEQKKENLILLDSAKFKDQNIDQKLRSRPEVNLKRCDDILGLLHKLGDEKESGGKKSLGVNSKPLSKNSKPKVKSLLNINELVDQRISRGPTEKDGPGFIYMYKIVNLDYSKSGSNLNANPRVKVTTYDDDKDLSVPMDSLYKIGKTEKLEERIKATERKNKENYQSLFSVECAWRGVTEDVVHLYLKDQRVRREEIHGGTEWFTGDRKKFEQVMRASNTLVEHKLGRNNSKPKLDLKI